MGRGAPGQGARAGADAAAADLARARQSLGIERPEHEDRLHAAAVDVFRDADVLLRSLRTYEAGHARIDDFLFRLQGRLASYLAERERLTVTLAPRAVHGDAGAVFEVARIEDNPWFPLFADGVRRLSFVRGIDANETLELFNLLRGATDFAAPDRDDDGAEQDIVTALWERDFPHVRFAAVDSFVFGLGDEGNNVDGARLDTLHHLINCCTSIDVKGIDLVGPAYANGHVLQRPTAAPLPTAELMFLRAANLTAEPEVPESPRAVSARLLEVGPDALNALAAGCHDDPAQVGRYFGALLAALGHRDGRDQAAALERMRELCTAMIERGELRQAAQLLAHVARQLGGTVDVAREVIAPEAVGYVVAALERERETETEADALRLLGALSPVHAEALLVAAHRVEVPRLREQLLSIAAQMGAAAGDAAASLLTTATPAVGRDLVALLRRVGPAAHVGLEQATWNAPGELRADALRTLFEVAPHEESIKRAERGLREPDGLMRRLSLEFLVRVRPPRATSWIKARIEDEASGELDMSERKRLYQAFAQVGGQRAVQWLLEKLDQRNTLGRAKIDEERALAAWGLAQVRYREARSRLEQLSASRLTRDTLRSACAEALEVIDLPLEEPPPPPPDPAQRLKGTS